MVKVTLQPISMSKYFTLNKWLKQQQYYQLINMVTIKTTTLLWLLWLQQQCNEKIQRCILFISIENNLGL